VLVKPVFVLLARLVAVVVLLGGSVVACSSSTASPTPFPSLPAESVVIAAKNTAFVTQSVSVPANAAWTLAFDNQDNLPHNVVIQDGNGQTVFSSTVFTGPALKTQDAPALAAGSYTFTCAIHSEMKGTLTAS
jgi:plastocyanin